MRLVLLPAVLAAGLSMAVAAPEPGGIGLGLIGGEPTGLSAKVWAGSRVGFDAAVAWSVWRYAALHVHADVLLHTRNKVYEGIGFLPLYAGVGGRVKLSSGSNPLLVGLRVPFGAEYVLPFMPLGFFLEVVPVANVIPSIGLDWNGAAGFRYYFKSLRKWQ